MMYVLTDQLRAALKLPLGTLVRNEERTKGNIAALVSRPLVLVGDVTASVMTGMDFVPDMILVDNHTRRGKKIPTLMVKPWKRVKVQNDAGMIGSDLLKAISDSLRPIIIGDNEGPILIEVEGEEDLSTLACVDLFPVGSTVVYGQPDSGLVFINVDEEIKKKVTGILQDMEV
ncbi:MAG: DUF359 domain-containing protein [Thermoplasmata archaeon]|nr:DUF359 domain-containing protein [Thermoplasmata archaeon]